MPYFVIIGIWGNRLRPPVPGLDPSSMVACNGKGRYFCLVISQKLYVCPECFYENCFEIKSSTSRKLQIYEFLGGVNIKSIAIEIAI